MTPFFPLILFTSTPQASLISVYRVFEDFVVVAKLSTSTQKDSNQLPRKLAGTREDWSDKLPFYLERRQGTAVPPSLPHWTVCSQCLPRHVKLQAENIGHFSHRLFNFSNTFQTQKTPTKQTHMKTNPDLHVKSWCIIKYADYSKKMFIGQTSLQFWRILKVQEIELKKVSHAYQKKPQTIENQSAMDCSYWENLNIRLVPYLLAPYLENYSRVFIMGGKNNWLFSAKQNGLFVLIA